MKSHNGTAVAARVHDQPARKNGRLKPIIVEIKQWRSKQPKLLSIDKLASHPVEYMGMAIDVAERTGRYTKKQAAAMRNLLAAFVFPEGYELDVINEICSAAMNGRKRGLLGLNGKELQNEKRS